MLQKYFSINTNIMIVITIMIINNIMFVMIIKHMNIMFFIKSQPGGLFDMAGFNGENIYRYVSASLSSLYIITILINLNT